MDTDTLITPVTSYSTTNPTRRSLLSLLGLGTLAAGLSGLVAPESTEAKKKKKGKRKKKGGKGGGKGGGGTGGGGNNRCNGSVNGSASDEDALLQKINNFRLQNGRTALTRQSQLDSAAAAHSQDMAKRCFFDHVNPDGTDPFERMDAAGYPGVPMAENIYKGSGNLGSASQAFQAWVDSPGHKANMLLANATEIGIGTALDSSGFMIWTNVFGRQPV